MSSRAHDRDGPEKFGKAITGRFPARVNLNPTNKRVYANFGRRLSSLTLPMIFRGASEEVAACLT